MLLDTDALGPVNLELIVAITASAILSAALVVWMYLRSRRAPEVTGDQQMLDARGELLGPLHAGGSTQAMMNGERWQVRSAIALPKGAHVSVVRRHGLVLWVVPEIELEPQSSAK